MGLLDKLVKEGAEILKEVATDENKEKATELLNSLKGAFEEHKDEFRQFAESLQGEAKTEEYKESYFEEVDDGKDCRQRILEILTNEFPQYTVKENVSPTTIGGTGRFMDYSIVVYDGETPKLVMMLIGKTTSYHREYRWSREEAEKKGIPFINFIRHYPNTPGYISDRLHKYL